MEINIRATDLLGCLDRGEWSSFAHDTEFNLEYIARHIPYITDFVLRSQKFYAGDLLALPETEMDADILNLPFDDTYIESSLDVNQLHPRADLKRGRTIFLCTKHPTKLFEEFEKDFRYLFATRILWLATEPRLKLIDSLHVTVTAVDRDNEVIILPFRLTNQKVVTPRIMKSEQQVFDTYRDQLQRVFYFLTLLNCSNIGTEVIHPPAKLNKNRERKGQRKFFHFRTLTINKHYTVKREGEGASEDASQRTGPCLHWRRGHIRRIRGGEKRIWISPCVVGNLGKGIVEKHYKVASG